MTLALEDGLALTGTVKDLSDRLRTKLQEAAEAERSAVTLADELVSQLIELQDQLFKGGLDAPYACGAAISVAETIRENIRGELFGGPEFRLAISDVGELSELIQHATEQLAKLNREKGGDDA